MMNRFILIIFLLLIVSFIDAKSKKPFKLPTKVTKTLTLKGRKAPYILTESMTVEKGATLTLLPGAVIKVLKHDKSLFIHGTLIMKGKKGKLAKLEGIQWLRFIGAKLHIEYAYLSFAYLKILENNSGIILNTTLARSNAGIVYPLDLNVPSKGLLEFVNTTFIGLEFKMMNVNLPNSLANLKFSKCAFLLGYKLFTDNRFYQLQKIPTEMLAFGNKCDSQMQILYNVMNWKFKSGLKRTWYIYDANTKKTLKGLAKSNKTFSLKFSSKYFTKSRPIKLKSK
ncbi:MAG: hypothetical protein COA79_14250 [Planctomycetota bacterium]|nr:MAG: hypothetical protein COA79_14250 [Planctomycetota bacterium]